MIKQLLYQVQNIAVMTRKSFFLVSGLCLFLIRLIGYVIVIFTVFIGFLS